MAPRFSFKLRSLASWARKLVGASVIAATIGLGSMATAQTTKMTQIPVPIPSVIQRSTLVSHKSSADVLQVTVSLLPPNPGALQAFADSVNDPKSPNYRKFATPAQLGQMFGQPQTAVQKIVDYLKSKGFKVTLVADSRLSILAEATVGQAESAFNTTINNYHLVNPKEPGRIDYYSFSEPLQLPPTISSTILSVDGLDNTSLPKPRFKKGLKKGMKMAATPLTPDQTRVVYNTAPLYNAGLRGNTKNVAISSWDGFRLSNVPLYYSHFNLPTPAGGVGNNIKVVTIAGGAGSGTPSGEGDLDIQMVLGMAPLCNFTIYDGGGNLIDVLTQEQNDNKCEVISESYGWILNSTQQMAAHNVHVLMTAQGITYMAASGDYGTTIEPYAYPDYEPECLQVGGTIANVDSVGNRISEVGWSGSGGGWTPETASFNTLPVWQRGKGVPTSINARLVPDVALNAAGATTGAYQFYFNGSLSFDYDGTSFACPVFAGCLAVTEQKIQSLGGKPRLGRISDSFYAQNGRSDVWFDITSGTNGILPNGNRSSAGPFWDFVTGWGPINFAKYAATAAVTPPTVFNVSSVGLFENTGLHPAVVEGANPSGSAANLAQMDGATYSANSVLEGQLGTIVSMQATINTTVDPTKVVSLSVTVGGSAPAVGTVMVYIVNQSTGQYELLKSLSGTAFGSPTTITVNSTKLSNYFSGSSSSQLLIRCLVPRSRSVPLFNFGLDQVQMNVTSNLN